MRPAPDAISTTPAGADSVESARIRALLADYSIEASGRSVRDLVACATHVAAGSDVYISFIAGDSPHHAVGLARALRKRGYNPIPHIGARHIESLAALDDFLGRLAGEAGVDQVLAIGGDLPRPRGPFGAAIDLLRTGLLIKHGVRRIGFAGHPEGHPTIPDATLAAALTEKLALAADQGLRAYIVTQFCFDAAPISTWAERRAQDEPSVPVHIGLTGPASVPTLLRFALRCGVGNSMRALSTRGGAMLRLIGDSAPDATLRALAAARLANAAKIHFFPFGGLAKAARFANAVRDGAFALDATGPGFRVDY